MEDFVAHGPLVRLVLPPIRFLFVGSRVCSTLPSDGPSRDLICPCASLALRLHQAVQGTFTPKLLNMPDTPCCRLLRRLTPVAFSGGSKRLLRRLNPIASSGGSSQRTKKGGVPGTPRSNQTDVILGLLGGGGRRFSRRRERVGIIRLRPAGPAAEGGEPELD